jgi:predicted nuclease of predicted toxin-antitoxin system
VKFLVDEDLPRSLVPALRAAGFQAEDVRDIGLKATPDAKIFQHAVAAGMTLLTEDMGFVNLLAFPTGSHAGVVIAALGALTEEELRGGLVIIESGRVRAAPSPIGSVRFQGGCVSSGFR